MFHFLFTDQYDEKSAESRVEHRVHNNIVMPATSGLALSNTKTWRQFDLV